MKKYIQNFGFRKKIISICLIVSLIPVLILGLFSVNHVYNVVNDNNKNALSESLHNQEYILTGKISALQNVMDMILWNDGIKKGLVQKYSSNYYLYLFYKNTLDPFISTASYQNDDIDHITLFTSSGVNPHGASVMPLSKAENLPWYKLAKKMKHPFFYKSTDNESILYYIGKMYYSYNAPETYVCIFINSDSLTSSFMELSSDNYQAVITSKSGEKIFSYPNIDSVPADIDDPDIYIQDNVWLENPNWNILLYSKRGHISWATNSVLLILLEIILLCIVLSFVFASFLSKIILQRLNKLTITMKEAENGYYVPVTDVQSNDEISFLIHSYNSLITRINHLINEVLKKELDLKKYELKTLQAQINPHFLYNSLSLINSKAIMINQKEISMVAQQLSMFYRTMLNKGKSTTTLQSEIDNLRSYINIQKIMHNDSFDVTYDIDESLLSCTILNFIIQPIAENAIIHGIDSHPDNRRGVLSISCHSDENYIKIKVMDNGPGMTNEECLSILDSHSNGYGIKNVNQRIKLYYGDDSGLEYNSVVGIGTQCIISIPIAKS
jgi:two-component system sensor histidine kinase YesM